MKKTTLVYLMAAGLALVPVSQAFSAAPNPTPTRESKLLVGFEGDTTVTSDPDGSGQNRASINTDPEFVAEGSQSLMLDLNGVAAWHDNYFVVDLPEPIDIQGHQVLAMDVYLPLTSLDNSVPEGGWFQVTPHPTTTSREDDTVTSDNWLGMRNMAAGWNHLVWDLPTGSDTKITRLAFAGNTNDSKPYSGPIYVDNIRAYKGTFTGIQPDEKLVFGFENATDKDFFTGAAPVEINTDKQFVRDGNSSLKIDLTGQTGGWSNDVARADDWGTTLDVSKATALHLDVFIPEGSQPTGDWKELAFVVIGEGGEVAGSTSGFITNQWITLAITLTPEQAQLLTNVKGLYFIRNEDPNTPWNGPIYVDNLRAVVPAE